jgi:predicted  nucleic acid-binding Zn-ribbon protein
VSELEVLYQVQELDTRIFQMREREENNPLKGELEELEEEAAANRAELEQVEASLEELRKKQGRLEEEVGRFDEKVGREEEKLYGGKVNNPKELRGLQAEIRSLKRQKDDLETELLEEMERQDEIKIEVEKLRANQDRLEAGIGEKKGMLEGETAEILTELADLEGRRGELIAQVDEELLETYTHLLESRHNLAVVKVVDGVCQGCRVEMPGKEYDRFIKSEGVFRCSNCGRILIK